MYEVFSKSRRIELQIYTETVGQIKHRFLSFLRQENCFIRHQDAGNRKKEIFPLDFSCFFPSRLLSFAPLFSHSPAQVAKLVDARDLKSLDFGHAGSIPALGTIFS